jgi:hypothetical protein
MGAGGVLMTGKASLCMTDIGYTSCLADPDVWMRPSSKVCADGLKFYEYVLIYLRAQTYILELRLPKFKCLRA